MRTSGLAPPEYYIIKPTSVRFWPQASFEETEGGNRPYGKKIEFTVKMAV